MDPSLVGLHSNSRSNAEEARPAVNISSAVKWFHARREVSDLREEPRRGGRDDENNRQVSRCRHGATAIVRIGDWTITPFWTLAVPIIQKYRFNESTSAQQLFGIVSTGPLHLLPVHLDLYWLSADNARVDFNGTSGREQRQTLGGTHVGPHR
jgi:hypothetical protein